jgi:hypothetical protein
MGLPVFAIPIPPLKHNGYFCDWQTLRWGAGAVDPKRGDISTFEPEIRNHRYRTPRRIVHLRQQQQRISELVARGLEVKRDPSLAQWLGGAKVEETADEAYVPNTGMRSCETPALATGHPGPARGAHHREPEGDDFRLYGPDAG